MDIESLRKVCLSFKNVTEDIKWENHLCFCVGGKMFLILGLDEAPVTASFKASEEDFEILSAKAGLKPAPYLARYKWISVDDIARFDKNRWQEIARKAYDLIAGKLKAPLKKSRGNKKQALKKPTKKSAVKKKERNASVIIKRTTKKKLKNEKSGTRKKKK